MTDAAPPSRQALIRAGVVAVLAVVAAIAGYLFLNSEKGAVSTDDAYVRASMTVISPKAKGAVAEVLVAENQAVKAGDPLVRIDSQEYDAQIDISEGELKAAEAARRTAAAGLARLRAEESLAQSQVDNAKKLAGAAGASDPAFRAAFETARGQALIAARTEGELAAKASEAEVAASRAQVALTWAKRAKANTLVTAPVGGVVADVQAEVGALVQPGVSLMTIVRPDTLYVTANFKETQVGRLAPGQAVEIRVDALPHRVFTGKVQSLSPGSGSDFALLPFEPGAGNFTKIVQRVAVRIALDPGQPALSRLRSGLSAVVKVRLGD